MEMKLATHGIALLSFVLGMFCVRDTAPNWVAYLLFGGASGALMMAIRGMVIISSRGRN